MKILCLSSYLIIFVITGLFGQNSLMQLIAIDSPISVPVSQSSYFFYMRDQQIIGNGDLNGDGYNDIVICGYPANTDTMEYKIYIYLGGHQLDSEPDYILESPMPDTPWRSYGKIISYNSDLNGDGFDDLVVSAPNAGYFRTGKVYIYFGGNQINTQPDVTLNGEDYYYEWDQLEFGQKISTASDFNGDGYHDLVISSLAWGWGQVNVFFGGPQFDTISDWVKTGNMYDFLGYELSAGDFNGDGYDDLLIVSAINGGSLYTLQIFYGNASFDTTEDWETTLLFGGLKYVFLNQDINRDGFTDIFIKNPAPILNFCWGAQEPSSVFESIPGLEFNFTKLYFSLLSDSLYITADSYQSNQVFCYRYNQDSGLISDYHINEAYNPNGVFCISYYLGDINGDGNTEILLGSMAQNQAQLKVFTTQFTAVEDDMSIPDLNSELICYPNPFKNWVNIEFKTLRNNDYVLDVYNIKGQLVRNLSWETYTNRKISIQWDGTDSRGDKLAPGVYFIRLKREQRVAIYKLLLIK